MLQAIPLSTALHEPTFRPAPALFGPCHCCFAERVTATSCFLLPPATPGTEHDVTGTQNAQHFQQLR